MDTIIAALISAGAAIIVCVWNSRMSADKISHQLELHQAVTETKIEDLTREVRKHNDFAERVPVMEEKIRQIDHRVETLEKEGSR